MISHDYAKYPGIQKAIHEARYTLMDAHASQLAQCEQSDEAWTDAMNAEVESILTDMLNKVFDWARKTQRVQPHCERGD